MKKTKRMAAACALSVALALGCAPCAFAEGAATPNTNDQTSNENGISTTDGVTTGNTTVKVKTVANNISATLPLTIEVAGPAEGGDLTVPTNYAITNNSVYPIKVSSVQADMTDMTWALATAKQDSTSTITQGKVGNLFLTLQPAGGTQWTVSATKKEPTDWIVAAKSGEKGTEANIAVAGSISGVTAVSKDATAAVKVVYTIAATSAASTPASS